MNRQLQTLANKLAPIILPLLLKLFTDNSTYTPTNTGGATAGATTYTFQAGAWIRIGKLTVAIGQVQWSAATGTGEARISLPSAPVTYNSGGCIRLNNVTFANGTPLVLAPAGSSYFVLDSPLTNAANTRVQMEAAGDIVFAVFYFV